MTSTPETTTTILPHVYTLGFKFGQFIAGVDFESFQPSISLLTSFPAWYKEWWLKLVRDDPVHVLVETTLVAAILYFLLSRRRKTWKDVQKDKLTFQEEEELLREWKNQRQPIVPVESDSENTSNSRPPIVIHSSNGRHMEIAVNPSPEGDSSTLSTRKILNMATFDHLGMSAPTTPSGTPHPVRIAARAALDHYGCGSCGPRGFYGTIDTHVALERALAKATGSEDAILYSDAASAVTSTIAAFLQRGDWIVVDADVYEPIRTGVDLSRANVQTYQHNDMKDLRRVLQGVAEVDRAKKRAPNAQRRFVITEALFKNTGEICPLDELAALLTEFKYRLILDESHSFGVLGKTGRGLTELYNVPATEHMIRIVSLEASLGSIGGLTVGTQEVVDHQRLCGVGYCFSASSPPFTAQAALTALDLVEATVPQLEKNVQYMYPKLQHLLQTKLDDLLEIVSDVRSPIVVLKVADIPETEYLNDVVFLDEVAGSMLDRGIGVVATGGILRMNLSVLHTTEDMDDTLGTLAQAVDVLMNRFYDEDADEEE